MNHRSGGLPAPRFRFLGMNSSSSSMPLLSFACFLSRALSVESFCPSPSSDSEELDPEPDKLSFKSSKSFSNSVSATGFPPRNFCFRL